MKKRIKRVEPIIKSRGEIVFNLASDVANADWIRAARLLKVGQLDELKKLHNTPTYYIEDDENKDDNK